MSTAHDLECDAEEALEFCAKLLEDLEDLPERAEGFASSVSEKVESIQEWIDTESRCTGKMAESLIRMREGTDKWMR